MSTDNTSSPVPTDASTVTRRIEGLSDAKRALLEQHLRARSTARTTGIARRTEESVPPASFGQELLWHLERSVPGQYAYNVSRAIRLRGPLNVTALHAALDALVARHAALRTTFEMVGSELLQQVAAPARVAVEQVTLSEHGTVAWADVERAVAERARRAFDLSREPQFRVTLFALAPDEHVVLWVSHHVALDGLSATLLFRDLAALYQAHVEQRAVTLPELPIDFGDFAGWQRQWLSGERLERLLGYWRERLAGVPELLELPTDYPRPPVQSFDGGQLACVLPPATVAALKQLAQRHDTTLYNVLVAAYTTLLHRYSGQDDIVIGSPVAGRTRVETEQVVGYFANTLVHRNDFAADPTFAQLLGGVRETFLGALEHQDVPLEKLVMELRRDQQGSHAPLFQCTLTMEDAPPEPVHMAGLSMEPVELEFSYAGAAKFDLLLLVMEQPQGLRLLLQYRTDLFTAQSAERMLGHLQTLFDSVLENAERPVSTIPLFTPSEREALARWNATSLTLDTTPLHHRFARWAAQTPGTDALVCGTEQLTYDALNVRANQLAHHLIASGVTPGGRVGIALERSADMIAALLAVLKAGGTYVPLLPDLPASRLAQQANDAEVRWIVSRADIDLVQLSQNGVTLVCVDTDRERIEAQSRENPAVTVRGSDVAYVLFTSGSTGVPKGVAVTHENVANYTSGIESRLAVPVGDVWHFGTVSSLGADLGNTSICLAFSTGGTLHVIPTDVSLDGTRFSEYVAAHPLDVLKITPSHVRALMSAGNDRGASVLPRRWLITGGEALSWDLAQQVLGTQRCRLLNHYGPTETTIGTSIFEVTGETMRSVQGYGARTVPIGAPLPNTQLYVLDTHRHVVPVGVLGELYVGGLGVAQGYVNRPELTAERFVELAEANAPYHRAYRTGDRVRRLPDGNLEFLGRADGQVKIRGFRVELGEVEQALLKHPSVAQSVVVLVNDEHGADEARLVAYVVPKAAGYAAAHAERPASEALREWVASQLPEYMVPADAIVIEEIPLTANGKVDRKALQALSGGGTTAGSTYIAPRTETEATLAGIWAEVLKKEQVGATDSFFALGGHSLLAIRVLGKLSRQFGVRLPLRTLFDAPTVEQLAITVDAAVAAASAPAGA